MNNNREFANCSFQTFGTNSAEGIFSGHAAAWGEIPFTHGPRGGTYLERGAFSQTLNQAKKPFKVLWNHNDDIPIGITKSIAEDSKGLLFSAQLNMELQQARDVFSNIKAGVIDEMSIGFEVIKEDSDREKESRTIKEVRLWEISPVTFPANPNATITEAFSALPYRNLPLADLSRQWDSTAAKARVKAWAGDDMAKYSKAFVWVDSENKENFTAYKLPIADVIGGRLTAVPRGVFAAGAAVQGARGGVAIPNDEMPNVKTHLSRYYKKLDRTPPWEQDSATLITEPVEDSLIESLDTQLESSNATLIESVDVWGPILGKLKNLQTKLEA